MHMYIHVRKSQGERVACRDSLLLVRRALGQFRPICSTQFATYTSRKKAGSFLQNKKLLRFSQKAGEYHSL
jgi:hypothetical protein